MANTCDKHGRELAVGDVLKVFHFIGARGKRQYMYKQIVGTRLLGGLGGKPKVPYFDVSHLNMDGGKENYTISKTEGILSDCEILQSLNA